jgi:hypothetical protein
MLMTDPRIIVAIDTFDFEKANAILEQLNQIFVWLKLEALFLMPLENHFFSMHLLKDLKFS